MGTHTGLPWFARAAATAPTKVEISTAGHCSEEELVAYKSIKHPLTSTRQLWPVDLSHEGNKLN